MSGIITFEQMRDRVVAKRAVERAESLQVEMKQLSESGENAAYSECLFELLSLLHAPEIVERAAAVEVLGEVVGASFGDDGATVGRHVRESSAIEDLCELLLIPPTREPALLVLGNLVSDSVDPASAETKSALLRTEGAVLALVSCLDDAEDAEALSFAVGCLQNLSHDRDWSTQLVQHGVHTTLEALLEHPDDLIVRCETQPSALDSHNRACSYAVPSHAPTHLSPRRCSGTRRAR